MVLYQEKQKFNQWWLWVMNLTVLAFSVFAVYQSFLHGNDWTFVLPLAIGVLVFILLASLTLTTTVTEDSIRADFLSLGRTYRREDIAQAYVRTYAPLGEYGGWGYRRGAKGTAFNVMGNQGLQLVLKNGKRILIGTQNPDELAAVVREWLAADAPGTLDLEELRERKRLENLR